jgi:N4-(beta-N-acetylglucosaminyl)-L-asparaginase
MGRIVVIVGHPNYHPGTMSKRINRREFVRTSVAAGVTGAVASTAFGQAPAVRTAGVKPVVISAANGNFFKNGGSKPGVETAFEMITAGKDVLDAVIAAVNIVELAPTEPSVGYGGLPNANGIVQLDSCCMHGPKKWAGGVAALEGVRTPSRVAHAVASGTDHHLLVGKGAQEFARGMGFTVEDDLNTEYSRKAWLEWKRRTDPLHYLKPEDRRVAENRVIEQMRADGVLAPGPIHGTINCDAINSRGEICGVTTTSGLAFKIPGRVGDSPILGAGLYVDNAVGAAGSTGRGEANLFNLCSFFIVEELRRGAHPKDAGMAALKRVKENTIEKRLQKPNGDPNFGLVFYVLNARGEHAGVGMYGEDSSERGYAGQANGRAIRYAYCDENGAHTVAIEGFLEGTASA